MVVLVKVVRSCFGLTSQKGRHKQKMPFGECVGPKVTKMGQKVAKIGPTTCSKTKKALENLVLNFVKKGHFLLAMSSVPGTDEKISC